MVLEFDFEYMSQNDIFEYLLEFYAKNYEHSLVREENQYIFKIKGDEKELTTFCESLNGISNSVFLRKFEVKEAQDFISSSQDKQYSLFKYLTHLNSNAYIQQKALIENEWGVFCELDLSFDGINFTKLNKDNFKILLEKAIKILKNSEKIWIKNHKGIYELLLFNDNFECDFLIPCDIKAINSAFVCSNENLKLLASLEKPLIKLRFNAMFRKNHALILSDFRVKLAEDLFSFALCFELWGEDFKFLNVKKVQNDFDDFELLSLEERILVLRGFEFIDTKARELIFSKEDKNYARLSYLVSRFKQNALILELSKDYEDILLVNKELNLLKLRLPKNSKELYEDIKKDSVGARLLENYAKEFPLLDEEFPLIINNFFSLFCILGRILKLDEDFLRAGEKLLELADNTKIPRGVKIDYRLDELGNFDYARTLRSAMSFMLAGVEATNIAYGTLESLAYFLRDMNDDLREKKQIQIAVISGSLFEHKALLKNALKHIKDCKLSDVALRI
ncbi:MAG: hypothetical protein J1D99_00100 [Campylobacter sp.]|nr:hypothetical protein [Campylobacter sp.]